MPAWESPGQLAEDMRECFARLLDGRMQQTSEVIV